MMFRFGRDAARPLGWVAACALALSACGAGGATAGTGTNGTAGYNPGLRFAQCMRAHGVPSFPDPGAVGAGAPADVTAPAFRDAQMVCVRLLPGRGGNHPADAAARRGMLANAACMRRHGVPSYPDPTFSSGIIQLHILSSGINPVSPAFQAAARTCGGMARSLVSISARHVGG